MDRVQLAGHDFNTGAADADGTLWYCTSLEGWAGGPVDVPVVELFGDGGVYGANPRRVSRPIVLEGVGKPAGGTSSWVAAEKLNRVAELVTVGGLLVVFAEITRRATVRRSGPVRSDVLPGAVRFQVPLVAADPRRYTNAADQATVTVASGSGANTGVITNDGTAPTGPVVTVTTGTADSPIVVQNQTTGESITLNRGKTSAEVIVFDLAARTVKVDGVSVFSSLATSTRWWELQPGANTVAVSRGSSPANTLPFVFDFRDAWG